MRLVNFMILLVFSFSFALAAEESNNPFFNPIYSINQNIETLFKQSEVNPESTSSLLKTLNIAFEQLNPAEQYLYLMALANSATGLNKHHQMIEYLLKAKKLEYMINGEQLSRLPFLNLYKKLSDSYAGIGQFKKAYQENEIYIARHETHLEKQREKYIFLLEEKYEAHRKKDINTQLNNQTELKAIQIDESLNNEMVQRRNIYIVGALILVFIFLLLRLLIINKRIKIMSKQDILTGISNRKTLFRYSNSAIKRCAQAEVELCVLAINIDNFKYLNDTYGDYIGDEVLKKFALLGMEAMRNRDIFGRLDDATFIAVLPQASRGEAKAIAQHLKEKVTAFDFNYVGITQGIDISVSIVELSESLDNFEALLNAAMKLLYEIKDAGVNQIKIYR